jgi:hypothetical protein
MYIEGDAEVTVTGGNFSNNGMHGVYVAAQAEPVKALIADIRSVLNKEAVLFSGADEATGQLSKIEEELASPSATKSRLKDMFSKLFTFIAGKVADKASEATQSAINSWFKEGHWLEKAHQLIENLSLLPE